MQTKVPAGETKVSVRRRGLFWLLIAVGIVISCIAGWLLMRPRVIEPPAVPGNDMDAVVLQAIQEARQSVLQRPRSDETWGKLGTILIAHKLWEDSRVCFLQAERLDPKPLWLYYEGVALYSLGRLPESIDKLKRAVRTWEQAREKVPTVRLRLAKALMDGQLAGEAEAQFRQVLADDPRTGMAHIGLAQLAYQREDWAACRRHLEAAGNDPRSRKLAAKQLPPVCLRLNDSEAAARYEKLAAQLPPDQNMIDPLAPLGSQPELVDTKDNRLAQAERLYRAGKLRDAVQILAPVVARYPDDPRLNVAQGKSLHRMGQFEAGKELLRKAVKSSPGDFDPLFSLAMCLTSEAELIWPKGDAERDNARKLFAEAADAARQALAIKPASGFAHLYLGLCLKYLGQPEPALASLREAVHCDPEQWEPHLRLGMALAEHGETQEGRFHMEQAGRLSPNNPRVIAELKKLENSKR